MSDSKAINALQKASEKLEAAKAVFQAADTDVGDAVAAVDEALSVKSKVVAGEGLLNKAGRIVAGKKAPSPGEIDAALVDADKSVAAAQARVETLVVRKDAAGVKVAAAQEKLAAAEQAAADAQKAAAKQAERDDKRIAAGELVRVRATATRVSDTVLLKDQVYVVDKATADNYLRRNFAVLIEE